jgi:hypothetical protein
LTVQKKDQRFFSGVAHAALSKYLLHMQRDFGEIIFPCLGRTHALSTAIDGIYGLWIRVLELNIEVREYK